MKYAPVMPPNCVQQLRLIEPEAYFVYADKAAQLESSYFEFVYSLHSPYIVMDCPIVEKGKILDPLALYSIASILKPQFAIIPDAPFDRMATLRMFSQYFKFGETLECYAGVPQGESTQELLLCAKEMYELGVRRFGLPRAGGRSGGAPRSTLIQVLNAYAKDAGGGPIQYHLLGARWPYEDDIKCAEEGLASSLDTAEPVNAAMRNRSLLPQNINKDTTRYERMPSFMETDRIKHAEMLMLNIRRMQKWLSPKISE